MIFLTVYLYFLTLYFLTLLACSKAILNEEVSYRFPSIGCCHTICIKRAMMKVPEAVQCVASRFKRNPILSRTVCTTCCKSVSFQPYANPTT